MTDATFRNTNDWVRIVTEIQQREGEGHGKGRTGSGEIRDGEGRK